MRLYPHLQYLLIILALFSLKVKVVVAAEKSVVFKEIRVEGLTKSDPDIILGELDFTINEAVSKSQLDEGLVRIRNTNLFFEVSFTQIDDQASESKILLIKAKDRWTTIPVVKVSSGGGVSQLILGVYDPNVLGKNFELGAQFERLGDTNSGVVWYRNRRFLGKRLFLDVQAWNTNRLRTKYLLDPVEPVIKAGFLQTRQKFSIALQKEFQWWLKAGVAVESHKDEFSDRFVSDEVKQERIDPSLPADTQFYLYGLDLHLGRTNTDSFREDGMEAKFAFRHGVSQHSGFPSFNQFDLELGYKKTLPYDITFAERIMAGSTNTNTVQYWYYLGGFDRIRGFVDNRFAGKYFWLSNTELRVPVLQKSWLVVQGAAFYDVAAIGETQSSLNSAQGASVGGGLRFIVPQVYRLVARLDFATPVLREDNSSISFGVQQFF